MTDFVSRQDEKSKWRLNIAHQEVHEGNHYHAEIVDETMIDGEVILLAFKTPNTTKYMHVLPIFSPIVAAHIELIETATWTRVQQSTVNIYNNNRNAGNTSGALQNASQTDFNANSKMQGSFVALQSLTNTGGVVYQDWIMAGGASKGGGAKRAEDETVLKQNTNYVLRLTADGAANGAFLGLSWYEHQIVD